MTTLTQPTGGVNARHAFHRLALLTRTQICPDASALIFDRPRGNAFHARPGQHVTVRAKLAGEEVRRSYSVLEATDRQVTIAVRRIDGGAMSTFLNETLQLGGSVDIMAPVGSFVLPAELAGRLLGFVAAGSGIVPVLAMMEHALSSSEDSKVSLLYVNRTSASTMFADRLHDLKLRHPTRCQFVFVTTREERPTPLLGSRPDTQALHAMLDTEMIPCADRWFVCGPDTLTAEVTAVLRSRGTDPSRILVELFGSAGIVGPGRPADSCSATATFTFNGRTARAAVSAGQTLLDAVLAARSDMPYSCRTGACATCRCFLRRGRVDMADAVALTDEERKLGYILACQSVPLSEEVDVDFDR